MVCFRFSPDPFNSSVLPSLKASLDLSAELLILSDVQRKVRFPVTYVFYCCSFNNEINVIKHTVIIQSFKKRDLY